MLAHNVNIYSFLHARSESSAGQPQKHPVHMGPDSSQPAPWGHRYIMGSVLHRLPSRVRRRSLGPNCNSQSRSSELWMPPLPMSNGRATTNPAQFAASLLSSSQ